MRMSSSGGGYGVEVTGLSPNATEKDLWDFFAFSGAIEHVDIVRCAIQLAAYWKIILNSSDGSRLCAVSNC